MRLAVRGPKETRVCRSLGSPIDRPLPAPSPARISAKGVSVPLCLYWTHAADAADSELFHDRYHLTPRF
jgi:hypothetical protein